MGLKEGDGELKRSTFLYLFDTSKENIKFIVQNLWIRIYDKAPLRWKTVGCGFIYSVHNVYKLKT